MPKEVTTFSDNVLVSRIGKHAWDIGNNKHGGGDHIDHGLIMIRLLREQGFTISYDYDADPKPVLGVR